MNPGRFTAIRPVALTDGADGLPLTRSAMSRLQDRLLLRIKRANKEFGLIEPDDRVMVCLSGGKDSYSLLRLIGILQRQVPFRFTFFAVNLDQGQPGFPAHILRGWLEEQDVEFHMLHEDTYRIVKEKVPEGKTYCSLCSRLRRGILYDAAVSLGATKIALGHHRDDVIETALMNMLYSGKLATMPPKLRSDDGRNTLIRPMLYCAEEDIAAYAGEQGFPILPCDLCGSQDGLKRQTTKDLIARLAADNPNVKGNMLAALANVNPSHLLDPRLRQVTEPTPDDEDAPLWH